MIEGLSSRPYAQRCSNPRASARKASAARASRYDRMGHTVAAFFVMVERSHTTGRRLVLERWKVVRQQRRWGAACQLDEVAVEVRLVVVAAGDGHLRDGDERRAPLEHPPRPLQADDPGCQLRADPNSSANRQARCWRLHPTVSATVAMGALPPDPTSACHAWRSSGATPLSDSASRVRTSSHAAKRSAHRATPWSRSHSSRPATPTTSENSTEVLHSDPAGIPSNAREPSGDNSMATPS